VQNTTQVAGLQDFRQEGPPGDIGVFQAAASIIVYQFTFSGVTYYVAQRMGIRGWTLVTPLNTDPAIILNSAMTAINVAGGGVIYCKAGTYAFTNANNKLLMKNYVALRGEGYGTVFQMPTNIANWSGLIENEHCRTSTPDTFMEIAYIAFDGRHASQTNQSVCSIYMEGVQHVKVHHCWFLDQKGFGFDSQDFAVNANHTSDVELAFNYCDYAGYNFCGFAAEGAAGATFSKISVHDNYVTNTDTGISFFGLVVDSSIVNNICYHNQNTLLFTNHVGIAMEPNGSYSPSDILISGNHVEDNKGGIVCLAGNKIDIVNDIVYKNGVTGVTGYGISLWSTTTNCHVSNNIITIFNDMASTALFVYGERHTVSGNRIDGLASNGVTISWGADYSLFTDNYVIEASSYCITLYNGLYNTFNDNIIYSTAGSGFAAFRIGFSGTSSYNKFTDNKIYNHATGFDVTAGDTANIIEENEFYTVTTPVADAGTGTIIRRNIGYITENTVLSPAFAIDGVATVTVTIPHGLAITPAIQDCSLTVVEDTNVDDWGYNLVKVDSVDAVNVVAKVNVSVASATAGATAKLSLRVGKE